MALVIALKWARRADIAIVGYGDFPMAAALTPAITVVDQDPGALVRRRTVLPVGLIPPRIRRTAADREMSEPGPTRPAGS
jgi:DNA-binding LacI/PurR family transcriptional regulator